MPAKSCTTSTKIAALYRLHDAMQTSSEVRFGTKRHEMKSIQATLSTRVRVDLAAVEAQNVLELVVEAFPGRRVDDRLLDLGKKHIMCSFLVIFGDLGKRVDNSV